MAFDAGVPRPKSPLPDWAVDRILKVRELILANPERFDMKDWEVERDCGTVRCIGGWVRDMFGPKDLIDGEVGELIGLNWNQSRELFYPRRYFVEYSCSGYQATAEQAAKVLDQIGRAHV